MLNHLKYCLKEILVVKKILEIENSNFYKRSLARFIALRTDEFIKLAFSINKASLNQQLIKDELNTFQEYYKQHFKIQRDKFGAHFQELDLASRLEFWSQIDYEKSNFFSSIPIDIYTKFNTLTVYERPEVLFSGISEELQNKIKQLNSDLDIEKYPNFSFDILSLTRYNSGGLIPSSKLQVKAGVLKSLEILLEYSIRLYKISIENKDISDIIKKIIITDLVSYCDNFITRTDLSHGAQQEEDGLDKVIDRIEHSKVIEIINEFITNYKFEENLNKIRVVRNNSCGHIDKNIPVELLKINLDTIEIDELESFYLQIKKTYKKICNEELVFRIYRLDPKDRIYSIQKFTGTPAKPFEKNILPKSEFLQFNLNDLNDYKSYFKLLDYEDRYQEALHFFWKGFLSSKRINCKIENGFHEITSITDYRKAHKYFYNLLSSELTPISDKIKTLELFVSCKSGYPNPLLYILLKTYDINKEKDSLNIQYIYCFGELCSKIDNNVIDILKNNLVKSDFYKYYNSLLSIYKIDIKSRQHLTIDINSSSSTLSDLIKNEISNSNNFLKIVLSLAFSSELYFSIGYNSYIKALKELYLNYFNEVFKKSIKNQLNTIITNDVDKRKLNKIIKSFDLNHYSTLIGLLGEFLTKKKHKKEAKQFRALLYEGIIKYAYNNYNELRNFGVICYEMNDIDLAAKVSEKIVDFNPSNLEYHYFLLSIYLRDIKYKDRFLKIKEKILNDFKLDKKNRSKFEALNYQ